jgi:hypothetical protein
MLGPSFIKSYSALEVGEYDVIHPENCLFTYTYDSGKIIFSVMDGCRMGIDSHFASTPAAKFFER